MSAAFSIRDLFWGLEQSIRERFRVIEDILRTKSEEPGSGTGSHSCLDEAAAAALARRVEVLEAQVQAQQRQLQSQAAANHAAYAAIASANAANASAHAANGSPKDELLPTSPMNGLEVVQKSMAPAVSGAASAAPKVVSVSAAPAAPVPVAEAEVEIDLVSEIEQEDEDDAVAEVDAEEAEEAEEEEAEAEAEVELEEFEYKGATYYRDPDNNVFATDDDGELVEEPFGTWNPVKQRIMARKA